MKVLLTILGFIAGALSGYLVSGLFRGYREQIVKIDRPLRIRTADDGSPKYMLPAGTTLYFIEEDEKAKSTRYFVYVNVEGPPLKVHPSEYSWFIAPLFVEPLQ